MTKYAILASVLALLIGIGGGYWLAGKQQPVENVASVAERKPLLYRHPMNPKVTSPIPTKDEMGMDYLPVYADEVSQTAQPNKGRILYYRHPMGAADTSPVPKKDEMGMDYLPVYEGEAASSKLLTISPEKIQKLGVKTENVQYRDLTRSIRALGSIQVDERRLYIINAKFEGWIQRLLVNSIGQSVKRGQPLLEIYSPDLLTAQQEYLIAKQGEVSLEQASPQALTTAQQLTLNALQRLKNWDIGTAQLQRLQERELVMETLSLQSPVNGVVMEKPAVEGMRFMPGEVLFQIADLSRVWLMVDVFEPDLEWVKLGQDVSVNIKAYPDKSFHGQVSFIFPTLNTDTRTVKVRVDMDNAQGFLKPGLYGSVELIATQQRHRELSVPDSAILDSGTRQVALVQVDDGRFEPRTVKIGHQANGFSEVLEGLQEGDNVVTRANFLIDAESNLKSALDGMSSAEEMPESKSPQEDMRDMPEHDAHSQHVMEH
ncbi:efflux RND transporter periplasmic adaptor subunit [Methylicorpusculum sp.]|uniref:efflux RND transporter periplasmic adaptor subunit n=1 Tax=Methylicorpusculum sp. TaxID=2713644 RepID=UPI0027270AD0|nr:efflux RND transporter periplasmic adaptor subunit [Methylicorpusculum sp.]MDO9241970.1 efflux RND transporter periplasmic adaptor subunit [Methylicorpusculum sp.]MDP2179900.1 efflux RND transporter periplasmic adaptor subunit [Methylicorpusculum sp.]MDP3528746.1 efflux RND transporter periplasmic adaptor subunit [Methylicorpusculum sp.]